MRGDGCARSGPSPRADGSDRLRPRTEFAESARLRRYPQGIGRGERREAAMPLIDVAVADIARWPVDAVVAATGPDLCGGGGPSGSVQRRAGPGVLEACRMLRETTLPHGLEVGYAVATPAGELPARWVIHTVG